MSVQSQPVAILRNLGGLSFDAVFEETHEATLVVTDNPVETGVVVSDHAYMSPLKLTVSAGVSDTPLSIWDTTGGDGADYFAYAEGEDPFASDTSRSKKAFELLTELQKAAEPFSVQTGLKLYENMVCTTIRTSQDKDTSNVLVFTAELREVIIVSTQTVTYPPRAKGATARKAGPTKNKGEQQGTETTDAKKKGSLLTKLKTAATGGK